MINKFDPRLPPTGFCLTSGGSGTGKSTVIAALCAGGNHTFVHPPSRILVISRHPDQPAFANLTKHVETVIFLRLVPGVRITEEKFLKTFNIDPRDKGTSICVLDDVSWE